MEQVGLLWTHKHCSMLLSSAHLLLIQLASCIKFKSCCDLVQGTVASVQQDMQQRLEEALAENKAQAESLREARERNMHFSARVVALNSRVAQLTKQVCDWLCSLPCCMPVL